MPRFLPLTAGSLIAAVIAAPAQAQSGADFFKGKTVTYIVATSPGKCVAKGPR